MLSLKIHVIAFALNHKVNPERWVFGEECSTKEWPVGRGFAARSSSSKNVGRRRSLPSNGPLPLRTEVVPAALKIHRFAINRDEATWMGLTDVADAAEAIGQGECVWAPRALGRALQRCKESVILSPRQDRLHGPLPRIGQAKSPGHRDEFGNMALKIVRLDINPHTRRLGHSPRIPNKTIRYVHHGADAVLAAGLESLE